MAYGIGVGLLSPPLLFVGVERRRKLTLLKVLKDRSKPGDGFLSSVHGSMQKAPVGPSVSSVLVAIQRDRVLVPVRRLRMLMYSH